MLTLSYRKMVDETKRDLLSRGWTQVKGSKGYDYLHNDSDKDAALFSQASGLTGGVGTRSFYFPVFARDGWATFMYTLGDLGPGDGWPDLWAVTYVTVLVAPWPLPQGPDAWVTVDNGWSGPNPPLVHGIGPAVAPLLLSCPACYQPNLIVSGGRLLLWTRTRGAGPEGRHLTADLEAAYLPLAEQLWHLLTGR